MHRYLDRRDAGRALAAALRARALSAGADGPAGDRPLVLGLPRGGVPVAAEAADALGADLDVLVVRKIGHPAQPELAVGALASVAGRMMRVVNEDVLRRWREEAGADRAAAAFDAAAAVQEQELLRREELYRRGRAPLDLAGRTVVLVDDGLATGATMRAALLAARLGRPRRLVAAAPVSCADAAVALGGTAQEVVVPLQPAGLGAVGQAYVQFPQTEDTEVVRLLAGG